ncbi:hypothetical protein [Paraburkholderia sp. RL17-373-BIF-A]|uniref:hypothetical protein n=1 Tax=Paraburkholderia sp. RL17-373-BIF-A TaxID=3031629 RepID=UPI0038B6E37A
MAVHFIFCDDGHVARAEGQLLRLDYLELGGDGNHLRGEVGADSGDSDDIDDRD